MAFSLSRLTTYAIISSLEEDLRHYIEFHLSEMEPEVVFGSELLSRAKERALNEFGVFENAPSLDLLLYYIDFGDLLQLINRHRASFDDIQQKYFKEKTNQLEKLIGIRNRVAHSRPLNFDDLPTALDTGNSLLIDNVIQWRELRKAFQKLESNPSFVLGISIPDQSDDTVSHNLPLPDFDETGYLGRSTQVRSVVKLCLGPYPVISILGEGGIGKTALALKVAYEILDQADCPFDAIVWTSSKTTQLTPNEILRIEGAIHSSLGMLQDIAHQLAGVDSSDPFEEILDYMNQFRILLILDNLETVLDDRIRSFLQRLPAGSKILITSRIGLGAFEHPFKLSGLQTEEAVRLFRSLTKIRNVDDLFRVHNNRIAQYCNRMKNNPGYIKWFVSAVQAGSRPEQVIEQSDLFLEFCMSNVYQYLGDDARGVLRSLLSLSGPYSQAELAYINDYEALKLQSSLHDLLRTNMAFMSTKQVGSSIETRYELSPLARDYLAKHYPVEPEEHKTFIRKRRQLVAAGEKFDAMQRRDPYLSGSIKMRSNRDLVIAKSLLDVIKFSKQNQFEVAEKLLGDAKTLAPEYFEVYRVEAYFHTKKNNFSAALTAYESAIDLESNYAPLQRWFGLFLLNCFDDVEGALERFRAAQALDKDSQLLMLDIARCHLYLSNFDKAIQTVKWVIDAKDTEFQIQKIAYDLRFQSYYRRAEILIVQRDYFNAVSDLETLRDEYQACPGIFKDSRTLRTLEKLGQLTYKLNSPNQPDQIRSRSKMIYGWANYQISLGEANHVPQRINFSDLGKRLEGFVDDIVVERGYGFIRYGSASSQTIFFHFTHLKDTAEWNFLEQGDRVTFTVSKNEDDRFHASEIDLYETIE